MIWATDLGDDAVALGDLVFRRWGLVVEDEGSQHQLDRQRYVGHLDRYALFRAHGVPYVQATREKLDHARTLVGEVYRELVRLGYDGPAPAFGEQWRTLFDLVSSVIEPRGDRPGRSAVAGGPGIGVHR